MYFAKASAAYMAGLNYHSQVARKLQASWGRSRKKFTKPGIGNSPSLCSKARKITLEPKERLRISLTKILQSKCWSLEVQWWNEQPFKFSMPKWPLGPLCNNTQSNMTCVYCYIDAVHSWFIVRLFAHWQHHMQCHMQNFCTFCCTYLFWRMSSLSKMMQSITRLLSELFEGPLLSTGIST